MTTVVVPFAGTEGKTRLDASRGTRRDLSLAMLADVLAATVVVGRHPQGDVHTATIIKEPGRRRVARFPAPSKAGVTSFSGAGPCPALAASAQSPRGSGR